MNLSTNEIEYAKKLKSYGLPSDQIAERILAKRQTPETVAPETKQTDDGKKMGVKQASELNLSYLFEKAKSVAKTVATGAYETMAYVPNSMIGFAKGGAKSLVGEIENQGFNVPDKLEGFLEPSGIVQKGASKLSQTMGDFSLGAVKGVASTGVGLYDLFGGNVSEDVRDRLSGSNLAQSIGKGVEQTAEFFVPATLANKALKGINFLKGSKVLAIAGEGADATDKVQKLASFFEKTSKANPLLAKSVKEGISMGVIASAQSGEVGQDAVVSSVLGALSGPLFKIGDALSNAVVSRIVPTTITQAGKDIEKGIQIGKTIKEQGGFAWTKQQLLNKLKTSAKTIGGEIDTTIDSFIKKEGDVSVSMEEITNTVRERFLASKDKIIKKLGATPIEYNKVSEEMNTVLTSYDDLYKGRTAGYKDLQALKVDLGVGLEKEYQKAVGSSMRTKPYTEMEIRKVVKEKIEKIPNIKEINKKLAPLLEAIGRMEKKGNYSSYLTDIIAGSAMAGTSGESIWDNPTGVIKNFIMGALLKRAAFTTASRTASSQALDAISKAIENPQVIQGLKELYQSISESD